MCQLSTIPLIGLCYGSNFFRCRQAVRPQMFAVDKNFIGIEGK
jgi:hypothetical protein